MEDRIEPTREEQALELLVFLFLIVPSIVLSLFAFGTGQVNFVLLALSTIFRDLALVCLILFFLWRNGETGERIGWTTRDIPANVALGLALSPAVLFGAGLLDALLRFLGLSGPSSLGRALLVPHGSSEILLAFFLVVVVAVSEETIFRGYLIARLAGISRSVPLAHYEHVGEGILAQHYWVDERRRLLFAVFGAYACLYDPMASERREEAKPGAKRKRR